MDPRETYKYNNNSLIEIKYYQLVIDILQKKKMHLIYTLLTLEFKYGLLME